VGFIKTVRCIPCPDGLYMDETTTKCVPCPSEQVTSGSNPWGVQSCKRCTNGLTPNVEHTNCVTLCNFMSSAGHYFDFSPLAGYATSRIIIYVHLHLSLDGFCSTSELYKVMQFKCEYWSYFSVLTRAYEYNVI